MSSRWSGLALFAGAALISGFTILRVGAAFDEGLVLQAARRVADGELPYRDFQWAYGPADAYLLGGWFKAFGVSLLSWRILRVLCDAAVAVLVYYLVRRGAPRWIALLAWLATACAMAQPTSASPGAPALVFAFAGLAVATRTPPGRRAPALAGLLVGIALLWRLDFGLYAAGAVGVALLVTSQPMRDRLRAVGVFSACTTAVALIGYGPFIVATGPADFYEAILGRSLDERDYWTLPFPLSYDGGLSAWPPGQALDDAKDLLAYYVPVLLVAGLVLVVAAVAVTAVRRRRLDPAAAGLITFAIGGLLYLYSRADEFHTAPMLVALAAALGLTWAAVSAPEFGRAGRAAAAGLLVVLVLLAGTGLANRLSALVRPPALATIDLPGAHGAKAPPGEARALRRTVRAVQARVPPDKPIYTVTRRSDLVRFNQPVLYVLAQRDNATAVDFGLQTSARAQRRLVAELRRTRPRVVVRWLARITTVREPNLRGRPSGSRALDEFLARAYRPGPRYGQYRLLLIRR